MVMDGRTPQGIMSGGDPYADPRLAAVYRMLAESPDTAYRGSVLPFRRTTAGTTELAMPGFLMDAARGAVDLMAGVHTGQMSPEATQAMAGFAGSSAMQAPQPGLLAAIKAYHGSPHAFDRFDMSKIGTGEGWQSEGHGLYFAGDKNVAEYYRKALTEPGVYSFDGAKVDRDGAIARVAKEVRGAASISDAEAEAVAKDVVLYRESNGLFPIPTNIPEDAYSAANAASARLKPDKGSLYHVTLSPDEDDLLDWDAPLSEQPEKVRDALKQFDPIFEKAGYPGGLSGYQGKIDGRTIYERLAIHAGNKQGLDYDGASRLLREAGVPGLRYFDGTSRKKGEGTRNYVMFDDKLVAIDKVER